MRNLLLLLSTSHFFVFCTRRNQEKAQTVSDTICKCKKRFGLTVMMLLFTTMLNAQPKVLCFTDNSLIADLTLGFSNTIIEADLTVCLTSSSLSAIDVCFLSSPTLSSIDIELTNNSLYADKKICLTNNTLIADKTIRITTYSISSDFNVCLRDTPSISSKDIYVKGVDPKRLSVEAKVAILYVLGLLKKN